MRTAQVLEVATQQLGNLKGHELDVVSIGRPHSLQEALNLSKIVSKLSPILGNLIEFNVVEFLNTIQDFASIGRWKRQDPGFPDAVFESGISPTPGFEIKAWFPMATEITARFKDSQKHFLQDQTHVLFLAWLPEHLVYGKPVIQDLCVVSGRSIAQARDNHYHNPPDYLVVEPNDTSQRTVNLQQTNTEGYKFQGSDEDFAEAKRVVSSWGKDGRAYSIDAKCQDRIHALRSKFRYRLDTNFAKTDRIMHTEIEEFKTRVLSTRVHGLEIRQWARLLASEDETLITKALTERVGW